MSGPGVPQTRIFGSYPDGCPLPEAIDADGVAFRITEFDPPTDADFQSLHELGEEPPPKTTGRQRCRRRAISIYRTIEDARQHVVKYPYSSNYIAFGNLSPIMGLTLLTPPADGSRQTHTELWCADGFDRKQPFKVVESHVDD